ncbi:MAG: fumarate hydratase C-terminal domain-containing protein [Clostridia bacterium]|nr:fumarate hydratase C-terminal domain-containing protein [Clostridia bacterium]MBQ3128199.1 fumarate hydratase C-terminal domain-containing protein [Clostridia bacterium]
MAEYIIDTADLKQRAPELHAGDRVILSGTVYTSRDAAHKRLVSIINEGGELPFPLDGACIYYAGPTPAPEGLPIGSCGPTTSSRMDPFAPLLLDKGLAAMIGKGERNSAVCEAVKRNKAVYLCAIGGAGALAAKCVEECEEIAFFDLGCESVKRIKIKDFPLIVGIDCHGGTMFKE